MERTFNFEEGEVLLIDKPLGWTSHDLVNKVKKVVCRHSKVPFRKMKVGHAGTLDPLASGLMIVLTGKKTKQQDQFMGMPKTYTGTFTLGGSTASYDLEKTVDTNYPIQHITEEMIHHAAASFLGFSEQTPPVFSAKKIDGERAYHMARKGEVVDIKKIEIEITQFEITAIRMPKVDFLITCSKGTYIRSLARDFGLLLQSGAYLSALRRTKIGDFCIEDALFVEALEKQLGVENPRLHQAKKP
ncbi:MAG: tRNA pseudouridine(55) synthase TruB [Flavobacteriales bacterium]